MLGASSNSNIASRGVFVKGTLPGDRRKTQSHSGLKPSCRPDVLSKMPRSCNLVFDVLRSMIDSNGQSRASVRYLAQVTGLGTTAVWRALRRLRGAHLIALAADSGGNQARVWQLRWRSPLASFPQISVPLAPIRTRTRDLKAFSPNGTDRRLETNHPSRRALAWAMAQIRAELTEYEITLARKRMILTGIGAAIWRAMKKGALKAGRALAAFVHDLILRLREACGIGNAVRSWCSWAGWAVRSIIEEQRRDKLGLERSAELVAEIRREKKEAKGSLKRFLAETGVSSLREYIRGYAQPG